MQPTIYKVDGNSFCTEGFNIWSNATRRFRDCSFWFPSDDEVNVFFKDATRCYRRFINQT